MDAEFRINHQVKNVTQMVEFNKFNYL
jgi:hypothetical protein